MLKAIGTRVLRGPVGEPLNTEIAVRYTDAAKDPKAGVAIVFTCDPPGAVLFNGRQYATVNTEDKDRKGVAAVVGTIQRSGRFTVRAETAPNDEDHLVDFDIQSVEPVGVHRLPGGDTMVTHPWGGPAERNIPAWPIVAGIAAILATILLWKVIDKPANATGGGLFPYPPTPPVVSNFDPDARAKAQAALDAVGTAKDELRGEIVQGDTETLSHAEGYSREYTRPTTRLALLTARQIRERLGSGSSTSGGRTRPRICDRDPTLAACR